MYQSLAELFTGICNAIRSKDGTAEPIQHQDIPDRIMTLSGAGSDRYLVKMQELPIKKEAPEIKSYKKEDIIQEEITWNQEF